VLQQDRSLIGKRQLEPTGEPESLWGKVDPRKMGDRALQTRPTLLGSHIDVKKKSILKKERGFPMNSVGKQAHVSRSILEASGHFQNLKYRPKTHETQQTYEFVLAFVQQCLGDQPQDVLRDATDEVLALLKNDSMKDFDKKRDIEALLESLTTERFTMLMSLGKKITDYEPQLASLSQEEDIEKGFENDMGVAVVFDEDEESNTEEDHYEISDGQEEEEEEEEEEKKVEEREEGQAMEMMIDQESLEENNEKQHIKTYLETTSKGRRRTCVGDILMIHPQEVDAYWLQRQVSKYFKDALISQNIAKSVMDVLESSKDDRECENRLVQMLD
jgi:pre-mRNA-splicing helicase BRR2